MGTQLKSGASQPIKWHGGKGYLADWIIGHMPPHTLYREPFFGGGAVLLRKPYEGVGEAVNDANGELTNFWQVMADPELFSQFHRIVTAIPLSQPLWDACQVEPVGPTTLVESAARFFVRYRQSRQGLARDYATPTKRVRRNMSENVSAWTSAVDGLPEAHERLRRVEIRNMDACEFIRRYDSPDAVFYCDPPYLHETRTVTNAYEHEMSAHDHERLLDTLAAIEGKFLLSGYPSAMYKDFAARHGWHCETRSIENKASSASEKPKMTECLWMNSTNAAAPSARPVELPIGCEGTLTPQPFEW